MSASTLVNSSRGVRDLEELSEVLRSVQSSGKRVAHCHGVFDLLHIGHIRHLKEARRQVDLLVVTITPDHFVNKGPHRPAFPEALRAEALAALACVDYVAINRWPTAIETITLLRPDFYVKGPDYRVESDDITGGITKERAAIESVGGRIYYTDDITFSSSTLLNRFLSPFSVSVQEYLSEMKMRRSEVLALLSEEGAELPISWEASHLEYREKVAPYLDGKPSKPPTIVLSPVADPNLVAFIATATAYCGNGSPVSREALHKSIEHLLK